MWISLNDLGFGISFLLKRMFMQKVFKSKDDAGSKHDNPSYGQIRNIRELAPTSHVPRAAFSVRKLINMTTFPFFNNHICFSVSLQLYLNIVISSTLRKPKKKKTKIPEIEDDKRA